MVEDKEAVDMVGKNNRLSKWCYMGVRNMILLFET